MLSFFRNLFDTSDFPARWNCGNWDAFHGWLHIISDLAIWGAYFMIPSALFYYWWKKRHEVEFPKLFWLFGAFIFSCGITHFIDATIFYLPIYRVSGVMKFTTAAVSWMTVFAIIRIAPQAMTMPGRAKLSEELQRQLDMKHEMQERLAKSNRALEAYTGQVAHDLRNPLSGLVMLAGLAAESAEKGQSSLAAKQISMMLGALDRMENSVNELRNLSLMREKEALLEPIELNTVLGIAREHISQQLDESETKLTVCPLPTVLGNETLLIHLFTNLLDNAIKYRNGETPEIMIQSRTEGDFEIIEITDNGRGVPEEELGHIFESSYRASNVGQIGGSGIGLSLCVSVMDGHKGSIRALPVSGQGTRIEVRFPAIAGA